MSTSASAFFRLSSALTKSPSVEPRRHALNPSHAPVAVAHLLQEIEIAARITREPFEVIERHRDQRLPGVGRPGKMLEPLVEPEHLLGQMPQLPEPAFRNQALTGRRPRDRRSASRTRQPPRPPASGAGAGISPHDSVTHGPDAHRLVAKEPTQVVGQRRDRCVAVGRTFSSALARTLSRSPRNRSRRRRDRLTQCRASDGILACRGGTASFARTASCSSNACR